MGKIPSTASSQKLQEKQTPSHQRLNTLPLNGKKHTVLYIIKMFNRIKTSQNEYCISLSKYLEGDYEPWTPPTRKKNSTRIWGETTASHTLHIRAFMTKMWHFSKIPTPNRLGIDSNAPFASGFHQQRKKNWVGPSPSRERKTTTSLY